MEGGISIGNGILWVIIWFGFMHHNILCFTAKSITFHKVMII